MSTTTNLGLFKHDNPTTNTNQFDVDKSLNQNWDKLDKNAGEVASKIQTLENTTNAKDTSQDAEIETLKAENTLLKSQIPSATVVGETVHLEDSSNMQCYIMPLGARKQETREGYNLLDTENLVDQQTNGAKITKNKDGSFTINGTTTNSFGFNIPITNPETLKANKTYTLKTITKGTASSTSNSQIAIRENENTNLTTVNFSGSSKTYTPTADVKVNYLRIYIDTGVTFTNFTVYPLLYEGTEDKLYEQYGASPSIEHEAPIESVGDNINYLPTDESDWEQGAVSSSNGENTNNTARLRTKDFIDIPNNQCYVSMQNTNYAFVNILMYDKSGTFINAYGNIDYSLVGSKSLAVTFPSECKKIKVVVKKANDSTILPSEISTIKPKLEKGTKATPYSPYGQGSIEIYNCNDNLFDINNLYIKDTNGIASASVDNNVLTLISKPTYTYAYNGYILPIKEKGTHTLSFDYTTTAPSTRFIVRGWKGTAKTLLKGQDVTIKNGKMELTFDASDAYDMYTIELTVTTSTTGDYVATFKNVMLKKGETATNVPHQSQTKSLYTQQPFRAIGDVKDRFVKVDGVWDERHPVYRKIFDGTENITKSTTTEVDRFFIKISSDITLKEGNGFSNHFRYEQYSHAINTFYCDNNNESRIIINFSEYGTKTLEEFKAKLTELYNAGTPLYIDYVLEEPLLIPCTPEQVEVLESFNTYKNVTNISSDSIGELEVTYSKDLETLYNNLNQAVLGGN